MKIGVRKREFALKWNVANGIPPVARKQYDLFIGAAGSDARAYRCLRLCASSTLVSKALLFAYSEREKEIGESEKLRHFSYNDLGLKIERMPCSTHDPECNMNDFVSVMKSAKGVRRIAIDISVFTGPYFLAVLRALKDFIHLANIDVFYTEPSRYVRQTGNPDYAFTLGKYQSIEVPGYNGSRVTRNERLLIILMGFEGAPSNFIREELQPTLTIPINGFPSYLLHYKDISVMSNLGLLDDIGIRKMMRYATANDPFETYNTLAEIYKEFPNHAITLAPLGPKPMALGCGLYALRNPSIRITYPLPDRYGNKTSEDCGSSWLFRISL